MFTISSSYQHNQGWYCPNCNGYHSPYVETCPKTNKGNDYYPSTPTTNPYKPTTTWIPSNCAKCGLTLDRVMGYVCPHMGCPTGLGGAYSYYYNSQTSNTYGINFKDEKND